MGGISSIGFIHADFDKEILDVLREGVQKMSAHAENGERFIEEYEKMDSELGAVVERYNAPEQIASKVKERENEIVERLIRVYDVDLAPCFEKRVKKASIQILSALGARMRFDRVMEDCRNILMMKGFSEDEAHSIIGDVSEHRGTLAEIIPKIAKEHRKFLRLLEDKGSPKIALIAKDELRGMMSEPSAKIYKFPQKQDNIRPLRQARH